MSVTRTASRGLSVLRHGSSQWCQRSSMTSLTSSYGGLSSKLASPTTLITSSISSMRTGMELNQSASSTKFRRAFSSTPAVFHGDWSPPKPGEELYVTFIDKEGDEHKFAVSAGDNLLDIAQANDIEMEGACGGSCACSTCHVIVEDEALYDKMSEPDDDENDMLDLAFGLTETSRLGCQVVMSKELDGLRIKLPSMTRNMQASDFSAKN